MTRSSRRTARPQLRALADRLGIIPEYRDQTGKFWRRTSDETREVLLSVMGFDAPTEDAARGWLAELDHEAVSGIVDSVHVAERDSASARSIRVRMPPALGSRAQVRVNVVEEGGTAWKVEKQLRGNAAVRLPSKLPYGYHRVHVEVSAGGREVVGEQSLIVVPSRCVTPAMLLGRDRVYGIVANLYAVRREEDWGIGDTQTLERLVEWAGQRGAEFVGINPLHALFNRGNDVSPYSPVSRLFRNHIYIDVDRAAGDSGPGARQDTQAIPESRDSSPALVDYEAVLTRKERTLRGLHREFLARGGSSEYDAFVREREPELTRFATWMSIAEDAGSTDWRTWPEPMRDPESADVAAYRAANAHRVDFHRWAQFTLHRQLGDAAARARVLGMRIGVYQDLAIGINPGGSDTWSYPDLFLRGAAIGAPPDPYSAIGQNWGLPPMDPRTLRAQGYRYWVQLLRRAFEHAGALRIDHVMGLFRSFWIPDGGTGLDGAYVRFPSTDLLGILALESVRSDALVVGEDLGTVPDDVPPAMRKWGLMSSKVLYFEKDGSEFRPASKYPALSLATANTHDMAPLAGFWRERDIEIRRDVGLTQTDAEHRAAIEERQRERESLLAHAPVEPGADATPASPALAAAVHRYLCKSPAALVGISYDDLLGETEPVNVPGVGPDRFPSWRRRNRMTIEAAGWSPEVEAALGCESRRRKP